MAIDIQKWLKDNLATLNLSDEEKAMAERLSAGEFGKRLGANAYPQEAVSGLQSALDKQKSERLAREQELENFNLQWQERYKQDVYELGGIDRLAAAGFDVTGLQNTRGGGAADPNTGQSLTAEQINALVEKKAGEMIAAGVNPVREGTLEYTEFIIDAAPEYRELTGQRLDTKKFREFAFAGHKEGKFSNLQQAFAAFTEEPRQKKAEEDRKKWESDKEKEIEMRVRSRMDIPEAGPEHGVGGPFDVANRAAATTTTSTTDTVPPVSREVNRQEFAKKFQDVNLVGL